MNNGKNNGEFGGFGFADSNDPSDYGGYSSGGDTSGFGSGFVANDEPPGFGSSDQDYDSYNSGYSSQGTSSGFAGGSYGSQGDSYGSQGSNYGSQGGGYGSQGGNYGSQGSNYDSQNNTSYGAQNYNSGDNDMNYDPDAPLYNPENDYDPNISLYNPGGSSGFTSTAPGSVSSATAVRTSRLHDEKKSKYGWILIIALVLVFMSIGGFILYKALFEKKTIKDYWESATGQSERETLKKEFLAQNSDVKDFNIITEGDDTLVYEVTYEKYGFTSKEKTSMDAYFEMIKPSMKNEIQKIMSKSNIREFKIVFRFKGRTDNIIGEYTYTL